MFETAFHDVYTVVVARPKPRESLAGGARVHLLNGLETLFARLNIFHLLRDLEARLQGLKQQRTGKKRLSIRVLDCWEMEFTSDRDLMATSDLLTALAILKGTSPKGATSSMLAATQVMYFWSNLYWLFMT